MLHEPGWRRARPPASAASEVWEAKLEGLRVSSRRGGATYPSSNRSAMARSYRALKCSVAGLGVGVCVGQHQSSGHVQADGTPDWAMGAAGLVAGVAAGTALGSLAPAPTSGGTSSSIVEAIGNTPLVELRSLSKATGCRILAKAVRTRQQRRSFASARGPTDIGIGERRST